MTTACGSYYWAVDTGGGVWKFRVYRTTDDFASYATIYTPECSRYSRTQAMCADAANPTNWVMGAYHSTNPYSGPKLFYSADDGLTWSASAGDYAGGQGITSIATDNHGRWFAATDTYDRSLTGYTPDINVPAKLLKSTNAGATWVEARTFDDETVLGYWPNGRPMYIGNPSQSMGTDGAGTWCLRMGVDIFRSINHGDTWSKVHTHPIDYYGLVDSKGMATDGNGVWLSTVATREGNSTYSYILRSTDNGATWTTASTIVRSGSFSDTYFGAVNTDKHGVWILGTNWCSDETDDMIYRSTDNGTSWSPLSYRLTVMNVVVVAITASANRHWLMTDSNVVNSVDLGETFALVLDGMYVNSLAYSQLMSCPPPAIYPGAEVVFV